MLYRIKITALALAAAVALVGCGGSGKGTMQASAPATAEPRTIGSGTRALANEAKYAMNQDAANHPNDDWLPLNTVSNWSWLADSADTGSNGLRYALSTYGGFVSNRIPGYGGPADPNVWTPILNSPDYTWNYGSYKGCGHGTQCVAFASMVVYRASGGRIRLSWNWGSMNPSSYPLATSAQVGDLVFYKKTSTTGHVGVCARTNGSRMTVIDSNYVNGDGGEVIGMHEENCNAYRTYHVGGM